jgi:hypothetical protein
VRVFDMKEAFGQRNEWARNRRANKSVAKKFVSVFKRKESDGSGGGASAAAAASGSSEVTPLQVSAEDLDQLSSWEAAMAQQAELNKAKEAAAKARRASGSGAASSSSSASPAVRQRGAQPSTGFSNTPPVPRHRAGSSAASPPAARRPVHAPVPSSLPRNSSSGQADALVRSAPPPCIFSIINAFSLLHSLYPMIIFHFSIKTTTTTSKTPTPICQTLAMPVMLLKTSLINYVVIINNEQLYISSTRALSRVSFAARNFVLKLCQFQHQPYSRRVIVCISTCLMIGTYCLCVLFRFAYITVLFVCLQIQFVAVQSVCLVLVDDCFKLNMHWKLLVKERLR